MFKKSKGITSRGVVAPTVPRIEIKRGGETDSEEKRFTKNWLRGKRERAGAPWVKEAHTDREWLPARPVSRGVEFEAELLDWLQSKLLKTDSWAPSVEILI